jgi:hypothetical protein
MKSNLNDAVVDEFLNSQTKEGTFKRLRLGVCGVFFPL